MSKMDPKLKELESSSVGTGLETPGQQCPPNDGTWDTGRTTANGFLTAGVGSNQGGNISSPTERVGTTKSTTTSADISSPPEHVGTRVGTAATPEKCRHNTTCEESKQFDPGRKREKAPLWDAAVTLFSFSGESWEASCLCFVFSVCALCVLCSLNYCSLQVITSQLAEKGETRIKSLMYATGGQAFSRLSTGEDKQHPVRS